MKQGSRPGSVEIGADDMQNESKTSQPTLQLGFLLPVIALIGIGVAAYIANEACSADAGCLEGARDIWRASLPDWMRRALRALVRFILSPWLWMLLIAVGIAEHFRPAREGQKTFSNGAVYDLVAWFLMDKLMFGLLVGMIFSYSALTDFYQQHFSFLTVHALVDLPQPILLVLAFVMADFLSWLHHLIRHKVPVFWIFHAIHHSQREMNIFTDDRVHPIDKAIALPISLIPMLVLQLDLPLLPWLLIGQMLYTHAYHGNVHTDYGVLRHILVTPQSHRIHHSEAPEHADKNFGVIFCIWDRIFGTHLDETGQYPQTGVQDPGLPLETTATALGIVSTYVRQFVYPFIQIWRRVTTGHWELPAG
jgi:sterol desaturase/sphingolipid hydroxylase (fatty acid hydroxylase superfamily)